MWHHLTECVVVCCVCVRGCERARACAALRWVLARARESTPPTHSLSTRTTTQKEAPSGVTHTARPRAARAVDARHAPSTVLPLGS